MQRILPGEVARNVTGRFYAAEDGTLLEAGYFRRDQWRAVQR